MNPLLIIGITAIALTCAILLIAKGIRDAKEIDSDCLGLSREEIDIYKMYEEKRRTREDRHLERLIDEWGKKRFGKTEVEFKNRSNIDEVDHSFMSHIR